jgi:hypothetical protein
MFRSRARRCDTMQRDVSIPPHADLRPKAGQRLAGRWAEDCPSGHVLRAAHSPDRKHTLLVTGVAE